MVKVETEDESVHQYKSDELTDAKRVERCKEEIVLEQSTGITKSKTIRDSIDAINATTRQADAQARFSNPVLQALYRNYMVLGNKTAAQIARENEKAVLQVQREYEVEIANIDALINIESRKQARHKVELMNLTEHSKDFEIGISHFANELIELEKLFAAHHQQQNPTDVVELEYLDASFLTKPYRELEQYRVELQQAQRIASQKLSKYQFQIKVLGKKLDAIESTIDGYDAARGGMLEDLLEIQAHFDGMNGPQFVEIFEVQCRRATLSEKGEKRMNVRTDVMDAMHESIEEVIDVVMKPYKAHIRCSGDDNLERLTEAIQASNLRGKRASERLKRDADAVINKYLK
ncbi:hypothetical protein KY320_03095 [Candidatus Woesearchaeota archaeon]|nr:hypothetical protein [Candidatus Woesearchaeota archaeon]